MTSMQIDGNALQPRGNAVDGVFPASKATLRVRLYLVLISLDVLSIVLALAIANEIRSGTPFVQAGLNIGMVLVPLYLVIVANRNVYSMAFFTRWRGTVLSAVFSLCAAAATLLSIIFFLDTRSIISREVFAVATALACLFLVAHRWIIRRSAHQWMGGEPLSLLMICDGVALPADSRATCIDAAALHLSPDINDPIALDRIGRILRRADRAVVACTEDKRAAWAAVLKGAGINGEVIAPSLGSLGILGASHFRGEPTLIVSISPLNLRSRVAKRMLDVAISMTALFILGPLLLLVALLIKLETPGPVLFVQTRLGRGNRMFPIYKFRSMRTELCDAAGSTSTARDDKRITRVGRFIRATSIDELPQLLNVLKGDMSMVGPRPHALGSLAGDQLFWEVDQRYWHRHAIKPGITGLAQVRGFRGATLMRSDLTSRLQADLEYLNGWTLWRDLSILLATAKVVRHGNAY